MKMRRIALCAAAAMTVGLAGCGSSSGDGGGGADGEYRVLVLGGLSAEGILADNSQTSTNAAKASVDFANANGGVRGKKVTITVIDDGGDPTTAVTKLREQIAKKKPDLVMDSGPSTVADAILPILKQNNILSFNIGPTATSSDPKSFPLNFDVATDAIQQLGAIPALAKEEGYTSVAVLHGNSAYGETYGKSSADALSKAGLTVTGNEEYDVAALDMTPQLEKLKAGDPDFILIDAYGAPLGYILKGVTKLGWDVPMVGNTSVSATKLTATEPPDGLVGTEGVRNLVMEVPAAAKKDASDAAVNDAVKRMLKYGPIKASLILGYNFDTLPLVMAAADAAKSTDAEKLAAEMIKPEVLEAAKTALIGNYGFTATRHAPQRVSGEYVFIAPSVIKDGQFQ